MLYIVSWVDGFRILAVGFRTSDLRAVGLSRCRARGTECSLLLREQRRQIFLRLC